MQVLAELKDAKMLVWDGDDYKADAFTKFVALFLDSTTGTHAVSFKKKYEVPKVINCSLCPVLPIRSRELWSTESTHTRQDFLKVGCV